MRKKSACECSAGGRVGIETGYMRARVCVWASSFSGAKKKNSFSPPLSKASKRRMRRCDASWVLVRVGAHGASRAQITRLRMCARAGRTPVMNDCALPSPTRIHTHTRGGYPRRQENAHGSLTSYATCTSTLAPRGLLSILICVHKRNDANLRGAQERGRS